MAQTAFNLDPTVKNVESFEFEPIKGYPMLQWKGKRPFRSTHYYPAQHKETHGEEVNGWLNQIFWGDNMQVMSHLLKKYRGQINLVYIDPPFDSKEDYKKQIKVKGRTVENDSTTFEEKQYSDIWSNDEYLQFLYERFILLRELMADNGSIYVHCDFHRGSYLKIILDEIFGQENFRNELIWKRSNAHSDSASYGNVHDVLYYYTKGNSRTWNQLYIPYTQDYIERQYRYFDDAGKRYRSGDLSASGLSGGGYTYEWKGITRSWRCPKSTMERYEREGKLIYTGKGLVRFKLYLDDMPGLPVQSVWDDVNKIHHLAHERLDYPTQKPEALLERIIKSSSNPGDIVFDCFMGSGTTQAVAMQLGRRFIGADINLGAVQTTTKRLIGLLKEAEGKEKPKQGELNLDASNESMQYAKVGFAVHNVNHYDIFRNPVQAKELLIDALELQPLPSGSVFDAEQDGFLVKIMPVNRIATKADLRELVMNIDQREWMRRREDLGPNKPVEHIRLVCMGHDPDLAAELERELSDFKLKVEVVDILRDRGDLEFKRDSQADVQVQGDKLVIRRFYPMNLLQKLSLQKEKVGEWRELVESVMIDFNYGGAVLQPQVVDIPGGQELVKGEYPIPANAGTIRVKITDLLSESLEMTLPNG